MFYFRLSINEYTISWSIVPESKNKVYNKQIKHDHFPCQTKLYICYNGKALCFFIINQ